MKAPFDCICIYTHKLGKAEYELKSIYKTNKNHIDLDDDLVFKGIFNLFNLADQSPKPIEGRYFKEGEEIDLTFEF